MVKVGEFCTCNEAMALVINLLFGLYVEKRISVLVHDNAYFFLLEI